MDRGKAGEILYQLWCDDAIPNEMPDDEIKYELAIRYIIEHGCFDYDDFCKKLALLINNAL